MILLRKDKLENWLEAINKNYSWLADKLEITNGYVSQITNGKSAVSSEIMGKLLVLTYMDFEDLFEIKKNNNPNWQKWNYPKYHGKEPYKNHSPSFEERKDDGEGLSQIE